VTVRVVHGSASPATVTRPVTLTAPTVSVKTPAAGAAVTAGASVPVSFQLLDSTRRPLPDALATAYVQDTTCAATVGVTGVQTLAATCPTYNSATKLFTTTWATTSAAAGGARGAVTIGVRVDHGSAVVTTTRGITLR
jgi:hypothetical protein